MSRAVSQCRLCRSSHLSRALEFPSTPLANAFCKTREEALKLERYPLTMLRCGTCGHHQLSTVVDPGVLFKNYVYASGTSKVFRDHFGEYAGKIHRRVSTPAFALEIGSNDGTMLRALADEQFTVLGVEPAEGLAARATENNLRTMNRFFDVRAALDIREMYGCADVWTANNVLAHVGDFVETLQALHHCTKPNTLGVFEVQYLGALVEGGLWDMIYHEHLDYWRLTELEKWLPKTTGWTVFDVEQVSTHGGSLRVWLQSVESTLPLCRTPAVDFLLARESLNNWDFKLDVELVRKIYRSRDELERVLPKDRSTVAYGAPAKLCTFLETLGIADRLAYVVDDSPLKIGLFAPGSGLEVRPATALKDPALAPKQILVTAWNFAESIVKNIRAAGIECPIIVPFPEVRVLQ